MDGGDGEALERIFRGSDLMFYNLFLDFLTIICLSMTLLLCLSPSHVQEQVYLFYGLFFVSQVY